MPPTNIVVVEYLGTYSITSPCIARTTFSGSKRQMPICHACSYYLCLSTSLTALHYSGSYVHSWVHVRLVVPVPRVLHIDGTILAWHVHLDARCLACWQKDEQSSRKKIEWKNIDSRWPRSSKEPRGGASALIIFNIIQRYEINQSSPQWTGRVRNTAAQCSYIILVHG